MRIVFAGTPEFAVPTLEALADAGHELVLVVTQPDRPAGRGRKPTPSPVKTAAVARLLSVLQVDDVNAPESVALVRQVEPDVMVVTAFGQRLRSELLGLPRLGCYNVHASLLPAYRGAAPINWAIINGETRTGVSVIRMAVKMDAGDVLAQVPVTIDPGWTAGDLSAVLAPLGAKLLVEVLTGVEAGTARPIPQDPSRVSRAPMLVKSDGLIDWTRSAREVHNRVRGMTPWPGAFTFLVDARTGRHVRLAVLRTLVTGDTRPDAAPGTVLSTGAGVLVVSCGGLQPGVPIHRGGGPLDRLTAPGGVEGRSVVVETVKPAGGREMPADAFVRGHDVRAGMRFVSDE